MTTEAREQLLDYIQSPTTRASLHAYVRRRGLADSAEDLVQTVLCDALTASAVPERNSELPRFVTGIARNKVIDEQRRRARWKRGELPEDTATPTSEEARDLLRRIAKDVVEPEERRALAWLVREHQGDSLYLLALEQSLEPSALRQRICRLRKSLRARYLGPLLLLLGVAAGYIGAPERAAPASTRLEAFAPYSGEWRVVSVTPERYRGLAEHVRIEGRRVLIFGPSETLGREIFVERLVGDQVTVRSGSARWAGRLERLSDTSLRLTTPRGSVTLVR